MAYTPAQCATHSTKALEQVRVAQPSHALFDVCHRPEGNLRVEVVGEARDKLALNRRLSRHNGQIVSELVVRGDERGLAERVVLRSTRAPEDLLDVEHAEVDKVTLVGVVELCALDDDGMGWEVDAPRQRRRTAQNLAHIQQRDRPLLPGDVLYTKTLFHSALATCDVPVH